MAVCFVRSPRVDGRRGRIESACAVAPAIALFLLFAPTSEAKEWARAMFEQTNHDFGVVAKGANVEYRFVLENKYVEDVRVAWVRSSCGCTQPRISKSVLKTYETGEIIAELDTRRFEGFKEATVTVAFDQPYKAEVQLHVRAFIRRDVVFQPGSVQFGTVPLGQKAQQRVTVSYAGRSDWQIVSVTSTSPRVEAKAVEMGRNADTTLRATQVTYDLEVTLTEGAPAGYFKEQLHLRTNDPNPQTADVPLSVEGLVAAPLSVYPSSLLLGRVQQQESVARNLVLKGAKPFKILEVAAPDDRFRFTASNQAASTQLMNVHFLAGTSGGRVTGKIVIKTDLGVAEVGVDGEVVGAAPAAFDTRPVPEDPSAAPPEQKTTAAARGKDARE